MQLGFWILYTLYLDLDSFICPLLFISFTSLETGGPQGWIVGPQLLEDSFYLTTHSAHSACPHGIFGGYDSDDTTKDDTFAIECHYDQVI